VNRWVDYGTEHILTNDSGAVLARVTKRGCCWYASLGYEPGSSGRFKGLGDAKRVAEKLVEGSKEFVRGH